MLDGLDQVAWGRLCHAYGPAQDVPHLIRALTSPSPGERSTAFDKLYGNLWHQGTIYEATSHAVPFLIELASSRETPDRHHILSYLGTLAEGHSLHWIRQTREAVKAGDALYLDILRAREHPMCCAAGYVLSRFPEEGERYWAPLRARYEDAENDACVRCGLAIATKEFSSRGTSDILWLLKMFERESDTAVRVALAVSIALSSEQRRDLALQLLAANLLTDDQVERAYHAQPWDSGEAQWDIIRALCSSRRGWNVLVNRFNELLFRGAPSDRLDYVRYVLRGEVGRCLQGGELEEGAFRGELQGRLQLLTVPYEEEEADAAHPDQLSLDL